MKLKHIKMKKQELDKLLQLHKKKLSGIFSLFFMPYKEQEHLQHLEQFLLS